jgi:hypothetical protein
MERSRGTCCLPTQSEKQFFSTPQDHPQLRMIHYARNHSGKVNVVTPHAPETFSILACFFPIYLGYL